MMKAFDYSDTLGKRQELRNTAFFLTEKSIAWSYVNEHGIRQKPEVCPVCDCGRIKYLFQRWDINYYICDECGSVFTPVDSKTMHDYLELDKIIELRKSVEYQEDASARRSDVWDDMLRWLTYRTYRYTGKKKGVSIIDYGDRFEGQVEFIKKSSLCSEFVLVDSILDNSIKAEEAEKADVLLYLNQLQHEVNPKEAIESTRSLVKPGGLLVISTRLGSGFDVLTLKGGLDNIFPYEHVMLPSKKGLEILIENAGFELLEILTPGTLDVQYVTDNIERLDEGNLFVKQLLSTGDAFIRMEFQKLIQKAGLSSFAQVVARKK